MTNTKDLEKELRDGLVGFESDPGWSRVPDRYAVDRAHLHTLLDALSTERAAREKAERERDEALAERDEAENDRDRFIEGKVLAETQVARLREGLERTETETARKCVKLAEADITRSRHNDAVWAALRIAAAIRTAFNLEQGK